MILWVKAAQEHFELIFYYKTKELIKKHNKILKLKDFLLQFAPMCLLNVMITFKSCMDHISP